MLFRLLSRIDRSRYLPAVISLQGTGPIDGRLEKIGVPVYRLGWKSVWGSPRAVKSLTRLIRSLEPDFVQGWLVHGNAASLAKYFTCGKQVPMIWNVRDSLRRSQGKRVPTAVLDRLLVYISHCSEAIVYNSQNVARQYERMGYDARRTIIIPNGFDCNEFRPQPECRQKVRKALGLASDVPLIGLFARVHPAKDHANFLRAANRSVSGGARAHFLLVGRGTDDKKMAAHIAALELSDRVHALGERSDVAELAASLDIATSCSMAEAFPNAVGEAMACGVPCVVTDVGDSALLVGNTGRIVPRGNSLALAGAWQALLELGPEKRRELGEAARNRILEEFSLDQIVKQYDRLYSEVVSGHSQGQLTRISHKPRIGTADISA